MPETFSTMCACGSQIYLEDMRGYQPRKSTSTHGRRKWGFYLCSGDGKESTFWVKVKNEKQFPKNSQLFLPDILWPSHPATMELILISSPCNSGYWRKTTERASWTGNLWLSWSSTENCEQNCTKVRRSRKSICQRHLNEAQWCQVREKSFFGQSIKYSS